MPYRDPAVGRARDLERYHRRTARRCARGLCPRCGKGPPVPGRRLCEACAENKRAGDRRRYAQARETGALYGGRDAEAQRRAARARTKRRYRARREAGLCVRCGIRPPVSGSSSCEGCRLGRNRHERARWEARRASGRCGKCGDSVPDGASRCGTCAAIQAKRPSRRAYSRKRYARRRARHLCTVCGSWAGATSRCESCARRSYGRSAEHRGLPALPPLYTVIEIATGVEHGSFDSEAEVAACLAFAKLGRDEVEIVRDASPMAAYAGWA